MGLPAGVKEIQATLDPEVHEAFARDYTRRRKSLLITYLLLLMGFHYLYLGRIGLQFAFFLTAGGLFIWTIADLFRIPGMVARQNEDIAWTLTTRYRPDSDRIGKRADFLA
jgi:TM2 domain-containing membrane protein YozV